MKRSGPPNPYSDRRRAQFALRALVRSIVYERAGATCWYAPIIPEIPCGRPSDARRLLEVDELRGGSFRSVEMYDPDRCRLTCPSHHDFKTDHKLEVLARLEAHERTHPWPATPAL